MDGVKKTGKRFLYLCLVGVLLAPTVFLGLSAVLGETFADGGTAASLLFFGVTYWAYAVLFVGLLANTLAAMRNFKVISEEKLFERSPLWSLLNYVQPLTLLVLLGLLVQYSQFGMMLWNWLNS